MIDLQLCCVSIQRNKLEFGIILSSYNNNENGSRYFIISIHSIAPLFTLHQISVMSERMRTIAVSSSFRTVFILFVCLTFLDDFSFICFYPFASFFCLNPIWASWCFHFIRKKTSTNIFCCCCLPSSFMYFVIHPNCLRSWNVIRKMCTK